MKWKIAVIIPLAVILISGCTTFPGISSGMKKPKTVEETHDLVVIDDIRVIPSVIYPDMDVFVNFRVKHVGDPKTSDPVEVDIEAYDFGPCEFKDLVCDNNNNNKCKEIPVNPQETKYFEIKLKAPNEETVAGLPKKCPVRIKVSYEYTAKTQVEAYVMTQDKFKELGMAGKSPYYAPTQKVGIGPVKIYFEFVQPQPFFNGKDVTFFVYAKNLGNGDVRGSFKINVEVLGSSSEPTCPSSGDLKFVEGETRKVKCTWRPTLGGSEEKMFYLAASAGYTYSYEKVVNVEVQPFRSDGK